MASDMVYDLIIVGAGPNGLIMGKTYLEVNPDAKLLLLDECTTVGGTWAKDRDYTGLKTNNLEGGWEYSDFPMQGQARYGLKHDQHIPGPIVNQYLQDFADHFDLTSRARLRCKAHTVQRLDDGKWLVKFTEQGKEEQLRTHKLVIATGVTNHPFVPHFEGRDAFNCPIAHVKNSKIYSGTLTNAKKVVLLNATKSAYDAAYAYAKKGVEVHWVIRKSGHGPCWMSPARVTPLKKRLEDVGCVRFISWLSPCIFSAAEGYGGLRGFLQKTQLGRKLTSAIWGIINNDVVSLSRYDEHPETAKLKPRGDIVWYACTLGIFNYDEDFLAYVRNGTIKVYDDDIDHLSDHAVHLASGTTLPADALICSTGWDHRPSLNFEPPSLAAELGIPTSPEHSAITPSLIARAETAIMQNLPWLAQNRPTITPNYRALPATDPQTHAPTTDKRDTPFRLYRFLAPPSHVTPNNASPNIAFIGFSWSIPTIMVAQAAALWITAYFGRLLPQQQAHPVFPTTTPPDPSGKITTPADQVLWETALHTQFAAVRYPGGFGGRFPDLAFENVPYVDMLMGDLGLEKKRKRGGWWVGRVWREWWEHYSVRDYEGLVEEWLVKEGRAGKRVGQGVDGGSLRRSNGHVKKD